MSNMGTLISPIGRFVDSLQGVEFDMFNEHNFFHSTPSPTSIDVLRPASALLVRW